jgi:TolB protein
VKEIYVSDYDGANQRAVTAHRNLSITPAWAPDGVSLAYVSYYLGFNEIFLTRPDGRPATRPAGGDPDRRNLNPAISPDGTKMLFVSGRDSAKGYYDVFVVNIDGTGLKNLTPNTPESGESAPAWNPSGTMIAFTSDRTGTNQIWMMTPEGLNQQRIPTDTHCDRPTWSLQNFIAFSYGPANSLKHDIALYDLLTAKLTILTDGVGNNGSPAVAPNGRHVVFNTTRWGGDQLAVVGRDGGPPKKLTDLGNNTYPNWSSSPR